MLKPAHPPVPVQRAETVHTNLAPAHGTKRISSSELLGQARLVEIAHQGHIYQLRLTAAGKLILTK
jgi:hemin uptake protein HemP